MTADRTITLERDFAAPPEVVYDAWVNPETLPKWFGPEGFTCQTQDMDLREGGQWIFTMTGHGMTFPNRHRFLRLVRPERIEFLLDDGDDEAAPFEVTVTLTRTEAGTRLTQVMVFPNAEAKEAAISYNAVELGYTTLAKLAAIIGVA